MNWIYFFFSVIKNNKVFKAMDTWRSLIATSGFASGHSSASIINKKVHQKFDEYDESFDLAADNYLFEKIYTNNKTNIRWYPYIILGKFLGGGMSTFDLKKSFLEIYLSRTKAGRSIILENLIYLFRRLKYKV